MTRIVKFVLLGAVLLCAATFVFAQQEESLGDVARRITAKQPPPPPNQKVYTNDDLQFHTVELTSTTTTSDTGTDADKPKTTTKKGPAPKSEDELRKEKNDQWAQKFKDAHKQIDDLTREVDVLTREQKLRDATFYADAGNRLRNQEQYAQDTERYKNQIADKQKQLDDAKAKLEDLREEARKDGASDTAQ